MRLKTPGKICWIISLLLVASGLALELKIMTISGYTVEPFWLLTASYLILAVSNWIKLG